ncbi:MAG TPA: hypothetical protein VGI48_06110 [Caldimonas sp.]|jgi:hypothetical protein
MNDSIKTRIAALAGSILITFASVYLIAGYAYPEPPAVVVVAVSAPRQSSKPAERSSDRQLATSLSTSTLK